MSTKKQRQEAELATQWALRRLSRYGAQPAQEVPERLWSAAERVMQLAERMPDSAPLPRLLPAPGAELRRVVAAALYIGGWVEEGRVVDAEEYMRRYVSRIDDLGDGHALGEVRLRYLNLGSGPVVDLIMRRFPRPRMVVLGSVGTRVQELVRRIEVSRYGD